MDMTRPQRKQHKSVRTVLSILLSLALLLTMMPLSTAYAATSADYLAQMEAAQAKIDQYQAQLEQDEIAMNQALEDMNNKKATLDTKEETVIQREYELNKQAQIFLENKVKQAWPTDVQIIKQDNYTWSHLIQEYPNYETEGYKNYQSEFITSELKHSNLTKIKTVLNEYTSKYGEGSFEKALTNTMGYFNTLDALDNIDRCNQIRGNTSELANYWVNVMGQNVPSNTPQLKISPYLMVRSAVSATLNGMSISDHIYGCCTYYTATIPVGYQGFSQNLWSGTFGNNTHLINPFEGWWTQENNKGVKDGHNSNIADTDFNLTGFGISNPNPYSGKAVASQDFIAYPTYGTQCKSYTTQEYRNGLISTCNIPLSVYNTAVTAYDNAKTDYSNAVTNYNNKVTAYRNTQSQLSQWQSTYNTAERNYENALADENGELTVSWYDTITSHVFKTEKIAKGANATPPTAPAHDGYTFVGWDSDKYLNVTSNVTIKALYNSTQTSSQTYTLTFKDGYNGAVIKTATVAKGDSVVPPTAPTHTHYRFDGWDSEKYLNVTSNATITAKYTQVSFAVTFVDGVDNSVIATKYGTKGSSVLPPKAPAHSGYIFNIWSSDAYQNMPDHNITVTAVYAKIGASASDDGIAVGAEYSVSTPKYKKVVMKKNAAKITIKSVSSGCYYQYQIRKKGKSKWTSKQSAKKTVTLKKLKKNTKYQIRVRACMKVGDATYYSSWKKVTLKTTKKKSKTYKY